MKANKDDAIKAGFIKGKVIYLNTIQTQIYGEKNKK